MSKWPRLTCRCCEQNLSYGTYIRHQNSLECPGSTGLESDSDSDSTFCSDSEFQSSSPATILEMKTSLLSSMMVTATVQVSMTAVKVI